MRPWLAMGIDEWPSETHRNTESLVLSIESTRPVSDKVSMETGDSRREAPVRDNGHPYFRLIEEN